VYTQYLWPISLISPISPMQCFYRPRVSCGEVPTCKVRVTPTIYRREHTLDECVCCMNCDKMKAHSEKSSIMTNRKSTARFPVSLRWTAYRYVAPKPSKGPQEEQKVPIDTSKTKPITVSHYVLAHSK